MGSCFSVYLKERATEVSDYSFSILSLQSYFSTTLFYFFLLPSVHLALFPSISKPTLVGTFVLPVTRISALISCGPHLPRNSLCLWQCA